MTETEYSEFLVLTTIRAAIRVLRDVVPACVPVMDEREFYGATAALHRCADVLSERLKVDPDD